ncbi:MAG TPA: hypothetical protein PLI51_09920 [bacterium]|nr:hypothetical protein [bacterium]HPQ67029.1 hypothetical protein [bacterium]
MKTTVKLAVIGAAILPLARPGGAETSSRSIREVVNLGTQGESGEGGGRYFPGGIGLWGSEGVEATGTSGVYSFNPVDYPIPPRITSQMGPGHVGTNEDIYMSGSAIITGKVNVPQAIVDEALAQTYTHCDAGWSCSVGSKLPVGLTGEPDDETEYAGPRDTTPLQGWKPSQWPPEGTFNGGTPCWPTDPGYVPIAPFYPQWDMNGDGTTSGADYDYFVAHGGFTAERGGSASAIPYTQRDDPTIMKLDKGVLVPASEGQAWYDDYYIDDQNNFHGTWKSIYFTGSRYRFNNFYSGASQPMYLTSSADFYIDGNFNQTNGCDLIYQGDTASITMAVKGNVVWSGEADFNVGGKANAFDLITLGSSLDLEGSADGTAGQFYAPLADVHIDGDGWLFGSVIAKSVVLEGSRFVCYPSDYLGPNGGLGGGLGEGEGEDPANPAQRQNWKEIISSGD